MGRIQPCFSDKFLPINRKNHYKLVRVKKYCVEVSSPYSVIRGNH